MEFDVFLAHNSKDKPQVEKICEELRLRGLEPWIDTEQILGGDSIPKKVSEGLDLSRSIAFFIGSKGIGRFQGYWELDTLIHLCLEKEIPIIPVLLPGVSKLPPELVLLASRRYIQFSQSVDDAAVDELVESIKREETDSEPNDLSSKRFGDDDYDRLRDLLEAGEWEEADRETTNRMLEVMRREEEGWLQVEDIKNFPSQDLRNIDRLWVKYSKSKFGFSVQKQIYLACGGKPNGQYPGYKIWEKFVNQIGWRVNAIWIYSWDNMTYDTSAPKGHLPFGIYDGLGQRGRWMFRLYIWAVGVRVKFWVGTLLSRADL